MPPEVEAALDKRTQMGVVGDLDQYTKFQAANAIEDAAKNPGGGGAEGIGLGMGMAVGQRMAEAMRPQAAPAPAPAAAAAGAPAGPPPLPDEQWFLGVDGQQQGPFDRSGLAAKVASGQLTGDTLVWKTGMSAWAPASQVGDLGAVLASAPPPLPPQG